MEQIIWIRFGSRFDWTHMALRPWFIALSGRLEWIFLLLLHKHKLSLFILNIVPEFI